MIGASHLQRGVPLHPWVTKLKKISDRKALGTWEKGRKEEREDGRRDASHTSNFSVIFRGLGFSSVEERVVFSPGVEMVTAEHGGGVEYPPPK